MDAFMKDIESAVSGELNSDWHRLKNWFERYNRFLEEAGSECIVGSETTELLNRARGFRESGLYLCAILALEIQIECLPDIAAPVFTGECLKLFMSLDNDTAKCAVREVIKLSHKSVTLSSYDGTSCKMIRCLQRLLRQISPHPGCLTAVHADFLQACISAKMYTLAMAFVRDTNIVEICPLESPITTVDFLRYFYYSGVVYMTLRKYPDALECFDQVLSTPAHAISAVAVEAYRKATLVSLIERGKPYTLPRSASAIMSRVDSQAGSYECKTYKAISRAFCEGISLGDLSKEVESGKEDLEKHFNFGLAQLVLDAYPIRRLLQASHTYATITVAGLGRVMGSPYAEELSLTESTLLSEISRGTVRATIDKQTNMVTFSSERLKEQSSKAVTASLLAHLQSAIVVSTGLRRLHADVLRKREFVTRSLVNLKSSVASERSGIIGAADGFADVYLE